MQPFDNQGVADRFNDRVNNNSEETINEYRAKYGNYISADAARELSPEYAASRESKTALTGATQSGATKLANDLFMDAISRPENAEKIVLFTSGGSGVGKTTVMEDVPEDEDVNSIVYDSNLSRLNPAIQKIDAALAAGHDVYVTHVTADPVSGFHGVIERAKAEGRVVPYKNVAETYKDSESTLLQLAEKYKDDPRVTIKALYNNAGDYGEVSLETLNNRSYTDLKKSLKGVLDEQYNSGNLPEDIYRTFGGKQNRSTSGSCNGDG